MACSDELGTSPCAARANEMMSQCSGDLIQAEAPTTKQLWLSGITQDEFQKLLDEEHLNCKTRLARLQSWLQAELFQELRRSQRQVRDASDLLKKELRSRKMTQELVTIPEDPAVITQSSSCQTDIVAPASQNRARHLLLGNLHPCTKELGDPAISQGTSGEAVKQDEDGSKKRTGLPENCSVGTEVCKENEDEQQQGCGTQAESEDDGSTSAQTMSDSAALSDDSMASDYHCPVSAEVSVSSRPRVAEQRKSPSKQRSETEKQRASRITKGLGDLETFRLLQGLRGQKAQLAQLQARPVTTCRGKSTVTSKPSGGVAPARSRSGSIPARAHGRVAVLSSPPAPATTGSTLSCKAPLKHPVHTSVPLRPR